MPTTHFSYYTYIFDKLPIVFAHNFKLKAFLSLFYFILF